MILETLTKIDEDVAWARKRYINAIKAQRAARSWDPEMFPPENVPWINKVTIHTSVIFDVAYVIIDAPWQPPLVDQIALEIQDCGWQLDDELDLQDDNGKPYRLYEYKHEKMPRTLLRLYMKSARAGSCELIQVGTRVVEQPIWQIKCEGEEVLDEEMVAG